MKERPDWRAHLAAWGDSGESMAGYCRRHGVSVSSMGYWRKRLKQLEVADALQGAGRSPASPPSLPMARVRRRARGVETGSESTPAASVRIVVGGVAVEVGPRFDAATLGRVLDVLTARGAA